MKIKEIINYLESLAPISSQESYDNSGLIVGDANVEVSKVLISLDCIEATVDEAIARKCELIIAHHNNVIILARIEQFESVSRSSRDTTSAR